MNADSFEYETIKQEINNGNITILDPSYCHDFNEYVSSKYPWVAVTGYRIDWKQVDNTYKRFKWDDASEEETLQFLKSTCLFLFQEACIIYDAEGPGLLVQLNDYTCKNLWRFLPPGFGTKFIVGVKRNNDGVVELVHECFVEIDVDCSEWLTASK